MNLDDDGARSASRVAAAMGLEGESANPEFDALLACPISAADDDEFSLFGQFIGDWSVVVTNYGADGSAIRRTGEWIFRRVLNGAAIQDVWIVPDRHERSSGAEPYEYGTSIRFYDRGIEAWRSTWIGPVRGKVVVFIGRATSDGILLEGIDPDDARSLRWRFSRITEDSFDWENSSSSDEGRTWQLEQRMSVTRKRPSFMRQPAVEIVHSSPLS